MKYKNLSLPHFLPISCISFLVNSPHKKCSHPVLACLLPPLPPPPPPCDEFKISPQPQCPSKSHKYNNYDKATCKVSPYCYFPQADLPTGLFTAPQLTLDNPRRAASLTRCQSLHLILTLPQGHQELGNKVWSQDPANHLMWFEPRFFRF